MSKNIENKPLPIGTVVMLDNSSIPLMIITQFPVTRVNGEEGYFDFGAVTLPIGLTTEGEYFFNREDIKQILFLGYVDSNYQEFASKYEELVESMTYKRLTTRGNNLEK